jgi:hypothetical protein
MRSYRDEVRAEALRSKVPFEENKAMRKLYEKFDDAERLLADEVVAEWVLSEDSNLMHTALVMISELEIRSTLPTLEELENRLPLRRGPSIPYDLAMVARIKAKLKMAPPAPRPQLHRRQRSV